MYHLHGVATSDPSSECPSRQHLLKQLQTLSIAMLKTATTAMALRKPETKIASAEIAGGYLAFSGSDIPLTRAIGVGTTGPVNKDEIDQVETFFRSRNSPVNIVISERTHPSLENVLASRGYEANDYLQNWWLDLNIAPRLTTSDIEVAAVTPRDSELWVRTVSAGFAETESPVDESKLPTQLLDTFYCLGFANGAQPFLARQNGSAVGGGVLHISQGMAQIRTASCRSACRRMGVQTALLRARLDAALKANCRVASPAQTDTDRLREILQNSDSSPFP